MVIQAPEGANTGHHTGPILEAVHLRKLFPVRLWNLFGAKQSVHAVEDASLALFPGRATALVGESGSGKTTVARMLAGLYSPTSGTIRFRGGLAKLTNGSHLRTYRRGVQLILQDPFSSLNPVHTVRYHLGRPLRIYGYVHNDAQETEHILSLLNRVSLSPAGQFITSRVRPLASAKGIKASPCLGHWEGMLL